MRRQEIRSSNDTEYVRPWLAPCSACAGERLPVGSMEVDHRLPYRVVRLSANKLGGMLRRFGAARHAKLGLGKGAATRRCCLKEDCRGGEHAKQRQDPR